MLALRARHVQMICNLGVGLASSAVRAERARWHLPTTPSNGNSPPIRQVSASLIGFKAVVRVIINRRWIALVSGVILLAGCGSVGPAVSPTRIGGRLR
jgi:hypothetical protein